MAKPECRHPVIVHEQLCALCGRNVHELLRKPGVRSTYFTTRDHVKTGLLLDSDSTLQQSDATCQRLIQQKRLFLVLDLDLTLVHAVNDPHVVRHFTRDIPIGRCPVAVADDMYCFRLARDTMLVKLRPDWAEFLHTLSATYEMHIYTMGTREYAAAIAQILDPTGVLFNGRVFSRTDFACMASAEPDFKNASWLFPTDRVKNLAVVVDDNLTVWRGFTSHVIQVAPFVYFRNTAEVNALYPSQSSVPMATPRATVEVNTQPDAFLPIVQGVLQRTHRMFFDSGGLGSVQTVLSQLRRQVFETPRVCIAFGDDRDNTDPYWNAAAKFGAVCSATITADTTMVLSTGPLVDEARRRGLLVIQPAWIICCIMHWRQVDTGPFVEHAYDNAAKRVRSSCISDSV